MNLITLASYIAVSTAIAIIWMLIARKEYSYNRGFPDIFGISSYPLIGWALGLSLMMVIFDFIEYRFAIRSYSFLSFVLIYWILLIAAETIGYHVFGVHNENGAKYKGIPVFDCIHAVWWMKMAYFALGPLMYIVCRTIGLTNIFV